jgi:hypothetical protein
MRGYRKWLVAGLSLGAALVVGLVLTVTSESVVPSDWTGFPGAEWTVLTPEEAGLDPGQWEEYRQAMHDGMGPASKLGEEHPDDLRFPESDPRRYRWGACVAFHGYLIGRDDPNDPGGRIAESCWGNPHYRFNSASVGKAFVRMALQIAVDHKLVSGNDHITAVWPDDARGELAGRKIDCGPQSTLGNIVSMRGGYYVSNGSTDGCDNSVCTGEAYRYSSGGYWRASQALTYVLTEAWGTGIQETLQRRVMDVIGVKEGTWSMLSGAFVNSDQPPPNAVPSQTSFYPAFTPPGYGCFIDPPYQINGADVVGGGGWLHMSPLDMLRVMHLIDQNGFWRVAGTPKQIMGTDFVVPWNGGNSSTIPSCGNGFIQSAVTTVGYECPSDSMVIGHPVGSDDSEQAPD